MIGREGERQRERERERERERFAGTFDRTMSGRSSRPACVLRNI